MVMTSTQHLTRTVSEKLNEENKNRRFLKRGPQSVFCQCYTPGMIITLGHTGNYNRSTKSLGYRLNPNRNQSCYQGLAWPSNRFAVWCSHPVWQMTHLQSCFWFLCRRYIQTQKKISNKYKNQWYGSNHNSHNCNIEHLHFGMAYHYSQRLPHIIINEIH